MVQLSITWDSYSTVLYFAVLDKKESAFENVSTSIPRKESVKSVRSNRSSESSFFEAIVPPRRWFPHYKSETNVKQDGLFTANFHFKHIFA